MAAAVFISHSSRDATRALRLVERLEQRGFSCWISSRDIAAGEDFQAAIVTALCAAPVFLVLCSANFNQSKEVAKEIGIAGTEGKTVIPVRLEPVTASGALRYQITTAQFVDLFDDYEAGLGRLCAALQRYVAPTPPAAGTPAPVAAPRGRGWALAALTAGAAAAAAVFGAGLVRLHMSLAPAVAAGSLPGVAVMATQVALPPIAAISATPVPRPAIPPNLIDDVAAARWAVNDRVRCARPYTLRVRGGSVTWYDGQGGIDVENVTAFDAESFSTRTTASNHGGGAMQQVGAVWTYRRLTANTIDVIRDGHAFGRLLRCYSP